MVSIAGDKHTASRASTILIDRASTILIRDFESPDLPLASRCRTIVLQSTRIAGDQSVGATLVPIPNTIVKPYSADGTPLERARESRPSPAFLRNPSCVFDARGV